MEIEDQEQEILLQPEAINTIISVKSVNGKTGTVVLTTSDLENTSDYQTGAEVEAIVAEAVAGKQDKLTAGDGITIDENNVISADSANPTWGSIIGNIANQTDLYNSLTNINSDITNLQNGKQNAITSSNKLNADLVDDTNTTNKFATSSQLSQIATNTSNITNLQNNKQDITDNSLQTTSKTVSGAINEVNNIAKGANQALSFTNYSAMVTAFNDASDEDYKIGQNIYVLTLNVPDLWVSSVETTSVPYTYTTDAAIISAIDTNGYIQIGYYKLSALETQEVDLTGYVQKTTTIAGVDLEDNITKAELQTALNIADGAQVNTIDTISMGGTNLAPDANKNVNIPLVTLTQAQYDALVSGGTVDPNTYYFIEEE